jgi:hypothetical protein
MKRLVCSIAFFMAGSPASVAQDISLEELQGVTIATVIKFTGHFKKERGEGPGYITHRILTKIGPGDAIKSTLRREVIAVTPVGNKSAVLERSVAGAISRPGQSDLGAFLWVLKGNSLVLLRTQEVGAQMMTITFSRSSSGLTCSVEAALAREVGAGPGTTTSAFSGKVIQHSMKQTSSTCSVSKAS